MFQLLGRASSSNNERVDFFFKFGLANRYVVQLMVIADDDM